MVVQCHYRHCVSAPRMDKCDDEHLVSVTKKSFVVKRKDGKPCKAGDTEAGAQERAVDERHGWEVSDGRGVADGLLHWYPPHGEGVCTA